MQRASRTQELRNLVAKYEHQKDDGFSLEELATWAIDSEGYSPKHSVLKQCMDEFRNIVEEKDANGVRLFVSYKGEATQGLLFRDRTKATWRSRQTFVDDQTARANDFKDSVLRLVETLNDERNPGEEEFQTTFNW